MTPLEEKYRLRMAGLCARTEQCEHDIRTKLMRARLPYGAVGEIMEFLKENGFIDNRRYAAAYARDKVRFGGWGRLKIRMALRSKRLDEGMISEALESIAESDYSEALDRALKGKARSLNPSDYADRQKLFRHLASRGFEPSLIVKAYERYRNEKDTDHNSDDSGNCGH